MKIGSNYKMLKSEEVLKKTFLKLREKFALILGKLQGNFRFRIIFGEILG